MAADYTVSLPMTINCGTCPNPPICSPSINSITVMGSCLSGGYYSSVDFCDAGFQSTASAGGYVNISNTVDENGCAIWQVRINIEWPIGLGGTYLVQLYYNKLRTGITVNDIVGTYTYKYMYKSGGTLCSGASADMTITVSP